jgi:hypothetical protein
MNQQFVDGMTMRLVMLSLAALLAGFYVLSLTHTHEIQEIWFKLEMLGLRLTWFVKAGKPNSRKPRSHRPKM